MLFYRKYLPLPELRAHISWFYILEYRGVGTDNYTLSSVANPAHAMVFNYGDRYRLTNVHYQDEWMPGCFLSGVSTEPYQLGFSGQIASLGVIFRSTAFKDVFKLPDLTEFINKRIDADLFLGKKLQNFMDALYEAPTPEAKIQIANRYFLDWFRPRLEGLWLTDLAANAILEARGFINMDDLAQRLCITSRHLRRIFNAQMGVSPKYFARIKRFGYAYYCLNSAHFNWRELTGPNGFYDQAHFIKEFKHFSGVAPSVKKAEQRWIMEEEE